jgi:hypothetical protein
MNSLRQRWFGRRVAVVAATVLGCSLGGVFLMAAPAGAATVNVTNNHDSGSGSLRAALVNASGSTTINVQAGLGTITLASPIEFPNVNPASITMHGNGIKIDVGGENRGLVSDANSFTFDDFTITGVGGSTDADAGAIVAEGGPLNVSNCTLTGNVVHSIDSDGGVLLSEGGPLNVSSCTVTNNTVRTDDGDGGILVSEGGGLGASKCAVTSNKTDAEGDGATLLVEGGEFVLSSCDVSHNTVTAGGNLGGGADSEGGPVTFRNVTVTCNSGASAGGDAAGGLLSEGGSVVISGSTIVGNVATTTDQGIVKNQINSQGPNPSISSSTVSDDTSGCKTGATTTTTVAAPTTTVAAAPVTEAAAPATTVAAAAELPRTGGSSSALGLIGCALVALGALVTYAASSQRRRTLA